MKEVGDELYIESMEIEVNKEAVKQIKEDISAIALDSNLSYAQKKLKMLCIIGAPTVPLLGAAYFHIAAQDGFDLDSSNSILGSFITALYLDINLSLICRLFKSNNKDVSFEDFERVANGAIDVLYEHMKNRGKFIIKQFYENMME